LRHEKHEPPTKKENGRERDNENMGGKGHKKCERENERDTKSDLGTSRNKVKVKYVKDGTLGVERSMQMALSL